MYEHADYLKQVDEEDLKHVDYMLCKLDAHCQADEPLGDFLTALIIGDLFDACGRADGVNIKYLPMYVKYIHWQLPSDKTNLVRPVVRVLNEVIAKHGYVNRDQVAKAAAMFRLTLRQEQEAAKRGDEKDS